MLGVENRCNRTLEKAENACELLKIISWINEEPIANNNLNFKWDKRIGSKKQQ